MSVLVFHFDASLIGLVVTCNCNYHKREAENTKIILYLLVHVECKLFTFDDLN